MRKNVSLDTSSSWDEKWKLVFKNYQNDLRHGEYIASLFTSKNDSILEIGAGSFRDTAFLNRAGYHCSGIDFSDEAVSLAQQEFPEYSSRFHKMDALKLDFPDKSFDISFSNGFIGLFDAEVIHKLLREQIRVTRKHIVITVHNAHNKQFLDYFERMKIQDPLFNISFFNKQEMTKIFHEHGLNPKVFPVGKQKKHWEDWLIKNKLSYPLLMQACFRLPESLCLKRSERLLCLATLKEK
ncbi:class I SAM-dependent methyltransferase [Vreelandella stevensii]|uniref:class I SAM-dependent methyltransferase n=1 Tax=Vreelandella stevensii TaxID=502821 RepID=UPI003749CA74